MKRIRRAGLCNHCYRLKGELKRTEKHLAEFKPRASNPQGSDMEKYWRERKVKVARQMIDLAKHEGESYKRLAEPVSGLDLEHEFRYVSERWIGQDLFKTWANILAWTFNETQRRLLYYMLRKMSIEYLREHRRDIAEGIVFREEREQGIA